MLTIRIIPCLDVHAGRVVKGINFVDLVDAGDPVACARTYQEQNADELVFLDITASSEKRSIMLDVVEKTASECFMPLTVGGGLRNTEDIRNMLRAGADKVSLNTAAVKDPELIQHSADRFGRQCIVVAIDAKWHQDEQKWKVYTHGGRQATELNVVDWAQECVERGAGEILLTSMDRDGTKDGYDCKLLKTINETVSVPVIASGGAGTMQHMVDAVRTGKADALLAASIFHFGTYKINEVKEALSQDGFPTRL